MFGDSPVDYMTKEQLQAIAMKHEEERRLKAEQLLKYRIDQLKTYSQAELIEELYRRNKI